MPDAVRPLVVVAASARPLAQSAVRAGGDVVAIDGFGDLDTRGAAHRYHHVRFGSQGFDRTALVRVINAYRGATLVYGGGLEWTPDVLTRLRADVELVGNEPETLELLGNASRRFAQLRAEQIPHPHVRLAPPADADAWLSKRAGACGGGHVRWQQVEERCDHGRYFQRYVPGTTYSVLFLANRKSFCEVGWNRLLEPNGLSGFHYRGAVNLTPGLGPRARDQVREWIQRLVATLGLAGLNGFDFVLARDGPTLIDVNARPPATLPLFDPEYPRGLVHAHVAAVRGKLPAAPRVHPPRGHEVVMAPRALTIPTGLRWPHWCADIAPAGTRLAAAAPVCSVYACADSQRIPSLLAQRRDRVLADLMRATTAPETLAS